MCAMSNLAHAKIVKWVDSAGVTHYSDKLPAQEAGRTNTVLSNRGVVVKKNDPASNVKVQIDQQLVEQNRRDSALLASYNSEEEIDLASSRNTKTDEIAIDSLTQRLANFNVNLKQNKQTAADLVKRNKKVPAELVQETKYNQAEIEKMQAQIKEREKSIATTRLRFENDKKRYAELKPRTQSLKDIKVKKKDLGELEAWRNDAQNRLGRYQDEAVYYKRAGQATPDYLVAKIQQTTYELARAEDEINAAKEAIKNHEQAFSK